MSSFEAYMLPCLNKKIFGIDCPGCGMQRSVSLLIQGDVNGAYNMYPAIFTIIIMLIILVLHIKYKFKNGHKVLLAFFFLNLFIITFNYINKFI
ncbi:DUF2752 domain-containing protein [Oceanihabitans sediminis]|uniref:DUF2752 domain-containing protein n=1 Tax=Oceanihabitans sediminis TaxID=1812012 RepID=A0A368P3M6_9FLAO|nr:DUF2752 domain-containing protein [Oceanihabitans sediminis]MDX1277155.1 DUF2752 domain-containing protein [Oceanihabitans sediminis]MDX1773573.1 DUF2752 domain-containing protein [Oceanihabitans sediminis]RBP33017.1 uncharacterized protein DUF2752 [Oceanihabitans sediminis]RCU57467.1 DUF2752 domain-containing protein [Oceanihabitans sediminis]